MSIFKSKIKTETGLFSVCQGRVTDLSEVPDEAFSGGMLGKGFAVIPESNDFFSPVDGKVESVAETRHAYTLLTADGLDVLVHIGVDTVRLQGEGFEALVQEGQAVTAGEPLARADISLIRERGLNPITSVLITNPERIDQINYQFDNANGGNRAVMTFRVCGKG